MGILEFEEGSQSCMRIEEKVKKDEMLCFQNLYFSTYKPMSMEKICRHKEYWQLSIPYDVNVGLSQLYDSEKQLSKADHIHHPYVFFFKTFVCDLNQLLK